MGFIEGDTAYVSRTGSQIPVRVYVQQVHKSLDLVNATTDFGEVLSVPKTFLMTEREAVALVFEHVRSGLDWIRYLSEGHDWSVAEVTSDSSPVEFTIEVFNESGVVVDRIYEED